MAQSGAPETEAEILRRGLAMLRERLPAGWSTRLSEVADEPVDAGVEVASADGQSATLVV